MKMYRIFIMAAGLFIMLQLPVLAETSGSLRVKPGNGSGEFTRLMWSDEFDGTGLPDPARWGYESGYIRNHELQYYTKARLANAEVRDGCLVITARKDFLRDGKTSYPITSASVISRGKGFWKRGRVEVRAKVPGGLGTWPAIWMLPEDKREGWPKCGEIDIMEHVGQSPDKLHFTVHTEKFNHVKHTQRGTAVSVENAVADFHVYALEWFGDRLDFYLDGRKVFTFANDGEGEAKWPFDKPFYLILNLAYGGAWGGAKGVDEKSLPQSFLVDYVRVWE